MTYGSTGLGKHSALGMEPSARTAGAMAMSDVRELVRDARITAHGLKQTLPSISKTISELAAALESAEKDAERYQALATDAIRVQRNSDGSWIARDMAGDPFDKNSFHLGHSLTEAIDAALSAKGSS